MNGGLAVGFCIHIFNSLGFGGGCAEIYLAVVQQSCDEGAAREGQPDLGVFERADGLENCLLFVGWGSYVDDGCVGLVDALGAMGVCCSIFHLDACFV